MKKIWRLDITFSKLIAMVMLSMSFILSLIGEDSGQVFMVSLPFVVGIITGKQYFERDKEQCDK